MRLQQLAKNVPRQLFIVNDQRANFSFGFRGQRGTSWVSAGSDKADLKLMLVRSDPHAGLVAA